MQIHLTRTSNTTHRIEITRADGSTESAVVDTRSFLVHDLVHFAVETELAQSQGFYGLLASGRAMAEINDRDNPPPEPALMRIEGLVGPLQSLSQERGDAQALQAWFSAQDPSLPPDFVARILARMRRLLGHWRGTPFGQTMQLHWTLTDP